MNIKDKRKIPIIPKVIQIALSVLFIIYAMALAGCVNINIVHVDDHSMVSVDLYCKLDNKVREQGRFNVYCLP